MSVAVVVPIRSFQTGKARLSGALPAEVRRRLAMGMAEHTVGVVTSVAEAAVVTSDAEVIEWADDLDVETVAETGDGLDAAAQSGVAWARDRGMPWMVLHSDLPLLEERELDALVGFALAGQSAIAPSADGGTSCLTAPGSFQFAYGPASARRHLGRMDHPRIVTSTGLLLDIDSGDDLTSALTHPAGAWLLPVTGMGTNRPQSPG